jgi:transcription elongation factor
MYAATHTISSIVRFFVLTHLGETVAAKAAQRHQIDVLDLLAPLLQVQAERPKGARLEPLQNVGRQVRLAVAVRLRHGAAQQV